LFNPVKPVVVLSSVFLLLSFLAGEDAGQNNTKLLRGLTAEWRMAQAARQQVVTRLRVPRPSAVFSRAGVLNKICAHQRKSAAKKVFLCAPLWFAFGLPLQFPVLWIARLCSRGALQKLLHSFWFCS